MRAKLRPNGSATTACATASCSVPRQPSCPTGPQYVVEPPDGWRFDALPADARRQGTAASWTGAVDRERQLVFELSRS